MWWGQLPALAGCVFFFHFGNKLVPHIAYWRFGNPWHPKYLHDEWMLWFYCTEKHRSGDNWRPHGVNIIPDEVPEIKI